LGLIPGCLMRRRTIKVARQRAFELRRDDVIGDDAYRVPVQELDWAELSAGGGVAWAGIYSCRRVGSM
jgi:monovalent cation/hydrogen antiporter